VKARYRGAPYAIVNQDGEFWTGYAWDDELVCALRFVRLAEASRYAIITASRSGVWNGVSGEITIGKFRMVRKQKAGA
jgi:hypothetical protein